MFECGLGTNNPNLKSNMTENGIPGASLRVWRDYFFNAKITLKNWIGFIFIIIGTTFIIN